MLDGAQQAIPSTASLLPAHRTRGRRALFRSGFTIDASSDHALTGQYALTLRRRVQVGSTGREVLTTALERFLESSRLLLRLFVTLEFFTLTVQRALDEFVLNVLLMTKSKSLSNDRTVLGIRMKRFSRRSFPLLKLFSSRESASCRNLVRPMRARTHKQSRRHVLRIDRLTKLLHRFLNPSHSILLHA
jgi:hypothetical protein